MNKPLLLILAAAFAAGFLPASALAGGSKVAAVKEDPSELKGIQQQMQDIDLKVSALRTDSTRLDGAAKMTPEARAEALKDASAAISKALKDVADATKAKKLNAAHARSFNAHLQDAKGYLDAAGKKAKACAPAGAKQAAH